MEDIFEPANESPGTGPWFFAAYDGECSGCWGAFIDGDRIRADGSGGYEAWECCGD